MGPIDEGNLLLSRHAAQKGNLDDSTNTIGKLQAANALVRECVLCSAVVVYIVREYYQVAKALCFPFSSTRRLNQTAAGAAAQ